MKYAKKPDPFYKGRRWEIIRAAALARDGYLCQESKRFGKMVSADTVHHAFPRDEFPEYQYALWNLVSLSGAKHDEMHDRNTNRLTDKGAELLRRVARRNGVEVPEWYKSRL